MFNAYAMQMSYVLNAYSIQIHCWLKIQSRARFVFVSFVITSSAWFMPGSVRRYCCVFIYLCTVSNGVEGKINWETWKLKRHEKLKVGRAQGAQAELSHSLCEKMDYSSLRRWHSSCKPSCSSGWDPRRQRPQKFSCLAHWSISGFAPFAYRVPSEIVLLFQWFRDLHLDQISSISVRVWKFEWRREKKVCLVRRKRLENEG